jgi:hypothetical protein
MNHIVILPKHVHGIILLTDPDTTIDNVVGAPLVGALPEDTATILIGEPAQGADPGERAGTRPAPTVEDGTETMATLGDIVGAFKSIATDHYILGVKQNNWPSFNGKLWQRNYYEHIIRDDVSLDRIRQYIIDNPAQWRFDRENPSALEVSDHGHQQTPEVWQR